ncbi:MAG: hypothetical protein LUE93_16730 [Bacteroides sp.]|nr:hypothetical protein [Bacteroides sp.]
MNSRINQQLRTLAESNYKAFNEKLIPTKYEIIGIRMPALKQTPGSICRRRLRPGNR